MLGGRARRRERIRRTPFPAGWTRFLEESVPLYRRMPIADREELRGHTLVLLAEKHFEGAAGLRATEEMKLAVAAQASVLLLHRATRYFPMLVTVLLYPGEYAVEEEVETESGLVDTIEESRTGESWQSGAIVLSWEDVLRDLQPLGATQNVVLHEFAHQLDAEDGEMSGAPILADVRQRREWADTMRSAFDAFVEAVARDESTVLDPYGAEDPAEFFAVVTETFFLDPIRLDAEMPDLYRVLRDFYRQDPGRW